MITRYSFGLMEIDGEAYRKDLIILPDGSVRSPWWRVEGHVLTVADIQDILAAEPEALVVGIGEPGMMKPDAGFLAWVEAKGIKVAILPTALAVREFNMMSERGGGCAGCFHLTC